MIPFPLKYKTEHTLGRNFLGHNTKWLNKIMMNPFPITLQLEFLETIQEKSDENSIDQTLNETVPLSNTRFKSLCFTEETVKQGEMFSHMAILRGNLMFNFTMKHRFSKWHEIIKTDDKMATYSVI